VFGLLTPTADGCGVDLASGGHPPPVLIGADGSVEYRAMPGGQVVGLHPAATFARTAFHLAQGETLLLYTDGLTEARTEGDERYEEEALLEFLRSAAPLTAAGAIAAVRRLLDGFGEELDDDTAVLAVGVPASAP
jgi:sigma-B regulation protein RsbU (phosphoserine phosphatase)